MKKKNIFHESCYKPVRIKLLKENKLFILPVFSLSTTTRYFGI
jgi:hypothetical protein